MFRLSNISIKVRLYALLTLSTLGVACVLALALGILYTFRVNGPVYDTIQSSKALEPELVPAALYLGEPYLTLQQLEATTQPEEISRLKGRFDRQVETYKERHAYWLARVPRDSEIRRKLEYSTHVPALEVIDIARRKFLPLLGKPDSAKKASEILHKQIAPRFRTHRDAVTELTALIQDEVKAQEEQASKRTWFWMVTLTVVSVATVLLGGFVGWFTIRSIVRTTALLNQRVSEMASGASDLTARIPVETHDEMGQLATGINAMIAKIQSVVARVRESSLQVLSTASQIAATAREQDATVQGLSSSAAQVAAAVREITATTRELSGTMNEVNERAGQAAVLAAGGRDRLASMEATMQHLIASTATISGKLASIREKTDSINVVVITITKVADQTNLLSINAAIEAEKAGEYGRGFLVVAREIRRLADQTAVATLDIENMVRHMQEAVTTGVMQMDRFSDEVRTGVGRVAEVNGQTGQIIEEVHGLTDRYHQVNEGMRNQAIGAEQINEAMASMTNNIRQTAAALEEFKRATAHLRSSIELLNQEITQFRI
jgi:methyl-accepting chemotaxis protein WspA